MSFNFYQIQEGEEVFQQLSDEIRNAYERATEEEIEEESEEDQLLNDFVEKASEAYDSNKFEEIVKLLFNLRLNFSTEKTDNTLMGSLAYFIQRIADQKVRTQNINKFVKFVKGLEEETFNQKIAQLGLLFNALSQQGEDQYNLFIIILEFAKSEGKINILSQSIKNIDSLSKNWTVKNAEMRALYKLIIEAIGSIVLMQELKFELIVKYISSYDKNEVNDGEIEQIQKYIVTLLSQENIRFIQSSILETNALKFLESKNNNGAKVLKFFLQGDLEGFLKFQKESPSIVKDLGLDADQYAKFVRIKAIPQFAEAGDVIKFSDFAAKLQVTVDEVEEWIILGIQYNLVEAQIDQYNETISISSNNCKYFQPQDWTQLDKQLSDTINKLQKFLQTQN